MVLLILLSYVKPTDHCVCARACIRVCVRVCMCIPQYLGIFLSKENGLGFQIYNII